MKSPSVASSGGTGDCPVKEKTMLSAVEFGGGGGKPGGGGGRPGGGGGKPGGGGGRP